MTTIAELAKKNDMPYSLPLRVLILKTMPRRSYTANGEAKEFRPLVVGDSTAAVRVNLYDLKRENVFAAGNSLLIRGYILRSERHSSKKYLVVTAVTKVFTTGQVNVPDSVRQEAEHIVNPPPAPHMPLRDVKTSPVKTMVSVKGQIVSEEVTKTWKIDGNDVNVKSVSLKDTTGTCRISLWRDHSESVAAGDFVTITNVSVTNYPRNEVSLSTTSATKISITEQPEEMKEISIEGYETDGEDISLCVCVNEEYVEEPYKVSASLITEHFGLENDVIGLNDLLPLTAIVKVQGSRIIEFE